MRKIRAVKRAVLVDYVMDFGVALHDETFAMRIVDHRAFAAGADSFVASGGLYCLAHLNGGSVGIFVLG